MPRKGVAGFAWLLACTLIAQEQPKPKLNIVIVEGDGAINNIRQRTAREPIVQVEDENHRPVAGAVVIFLLPDRGAGATFADGARSASIVTDERGRAVARGLRPNNLEGKYQIRVNASFEGQTASAIINQSNLLGAAAAGGGLSAKTIVLLAIAGAAGAAVGIVAATRGGKAPAQAAAVPIVITPGAPNVGGPR